MSNTFSTKANRLLKSSEFQAVFENNNFVYGDAIGVGSNNITLDIARGLSTTISSAERLKTLYGSLVSSPSDDHEIIEIPIISGDKNSLSSLTTSANPIKYVLASFSGEMNTAGLASLWSGVKAIISRTALLADLPDLLTGYPLLTSNSTGGGFSCTLSYELGGISEIWFGENCSKNFQKNLN